MIHSKTDMTLSNISRFAHKCAPYAHFIQQIFYRLYKSLEHWEWTMHCEHENCRSCSFDRICNYVSFIRITINLVVWYCVGSVVFRICPFYTKQPTRIHWGIKIWWYPQPWSFNNFMMEKVKSTNFLSLVTSCSIALIYHFLEKISKLDHLMHIFPYSNNIHSYPSLSFLMSYFLMSYFLKFAAS